MLSIKKIVKWSWMDVREMCIRNNWYDNGTCTEYDNMLNVVKKFDSPNDDDIFFIACDIVEHTSEYQTIENVMFYLANDVVKTFYEIEEK